MEWLIGAGLGAVGYLLRYLSDLRGKSGRADTTDAKTLWDERAAFMQEIRAEFEERFRQCKREVRDIQRQNITLRIDNHEIRADNMRLQFLTHPDLPENIKNGFIKRQEDNIVRLKAALADHDRLEALEEKEMSDDQ